jgi:hypothetical protein
MEENKNFEIWNRNMGPEEIKKLKELALGKINDLMNKKKELLMRLIETNTDQEKKDILIEMLEIDREIIIQEKIIKEQSESN